MEKPLHIVSLKANNILRIKAIEIVPNSNVVTLTGKNKAGKSSVLNIIAMCFGGSDFVPERPIRDGASKGEAVVDLGDIIAEIKFNKSGKSIEVRSKDGLTMKSPQSVLNSLWSKMCDPVKFIRLSETTEGQRKQAEVLRTLVGLDFTKLEADKKKAYDERTNVNRDLDIAKGKLANFPLDATAPAEEVSVTQLMEELKTIDTEGNKELKVAQEHNKQNEVVRENHDAATNAHSAAQQLVKEKDKQIVDLKLALQKATSELENLMLDADGKEGALRKLARDATALVDRDEDAIRAAIEEKKTPIEVRISEADAKNSKVRTNRRHLELQEEVKKHTLASAKLTADIERAEKEKSDQLAAAKFPLPGLSFDDSGVLINGVPFAQGSQAEQIETAIAIGLALNPRLRVIIVRDASFFDDETMAVVRAMAEASDAQIWQEVVRSDDPSAIVIEDGGVKE